MLSVLYQKSLLPDNQPPIAPSSTDGAGVAPSTTNGEKSQYAAVPIDGSNGTNSDERPECSRNGGVTNGDHSGDSVSSDRSVSDGSSVSAGGTASVKSAVSAQDATSGEGSSDDVDLAECVRRLRSLYVSGRSEEDEKMLSELEKRL